MSSSFIFYLNYLFNKIIIQGLPSPSSGIVENGLDLGDGGLVVEATVFIEPLLGGLLVSGVDHGSVYKLQILCLTLCFDELVGFLEDGRVVLQQTEPVPSLLDFGIQ